MNKPTLQIDSQWAINWHCERWYLLKRHPINQSGKATSEWRCIGSSDGYAAPVGALSAWIFIETANQLGIPELRATIDRLQDVLAGLEL